MVQEQSMRLPSLKRLLFNTFPWKDINPTYYKRMDDTVTLEIPKQFIQVIYQALDIATKQVGLNGAEALLVVAKELAKQTGEQPDAAAPPAEEETTE